MSLGVKNYELRNRRLRVKGGFIIAVYVTSPIRGVIDKFIAGGGGS